MKNEKRKKRIIVFFFSTIVVILVTRFLADVAKNASYSIQLWLIEMDAKAGFFTERGFITWPDDLVAAYIYVKGQKMAFVKTSDVARYLFNAGGSITGKCFRLVDFTLMIGILCLSLRNIYIEIKFQFRKFIRYVKKLVRHCRCH